MKILKIIFGIILSLIAGLLFLVICFVLYSNFKPVISAKKSINDIGTYARRIDDLQIEDHVKIIGLGEASHGNKEYQTMKLDVLKTLVEKHNVKAFAMEMDYAEGLVINDYVMGQSDKTIDEVMDFISFGIYQTTDIKNLIQWVKEYNEAHVGQEVHFYGYDIQNPERDLAVISDYLKANEIHQEMCEEFDRFVNEEYSFRSDEMVSNFDSLESLANELKKQAEYLSNTANYEKILVCIDNVFKAKELAELGNDSVKYGTYRDTNMAERVKEIEAMESARGSRLMLAGHNGHIGYAGSFVKTMGAYLKENYGDDYYTIGTDAFKSKVKISDGKGGRKNHTFLSGDILAYQAKEYGTYYLNFKDVAENSETYTIINNAVDMNSIGESFSILNYLLTASVRLHCEPTRLYDGMIFVYSATPAEMLE